MVRPVHNPGQWPRLMRAETAAAYVDEVSVQAFLRKVGTKYPRHWTGKGERRKWHIQDLDAATDPARRGASGQGAVPSLADDL
jgi:hypothetical protein